MDTILPFKGNDRSKVNVNHNLKCRLSLILKCGTQNRNRQAFIDKAAAYVGVCLTMEMFNMTGRLCCSAGADVAIKGEL